MTSVNVVSGVTKPGFQCLFGRRSRQGCAGNQRAKAECGHEAGSMPEWNSRHPQARRFNHVHTFELF